MTQDQYEKLEVEMIQLWLKGEGLLGWDCIDQRSILVKPGMYPARDMITGKDDPAQREYMVAGFFKFRNPKPVRIELDPADLVPYPVGG